jgi:alanine racemase
MNRSADFPHLRWAVTRPTALRDALTELLALESSLHHLDLRANAYGLGAQLVADVAADLGFRVATFDSGEHHDHLDSDGTAPHSHWLTLAHRYHTQLLQARVVNSKSVNAGAEVSYGGHYTTAKATHLALVAIGFADGVPRLNPVGGMVDAGGERVNIAGRITMDQLIIDTGDVALEAGDVVTVWGGAVSCDEWSHWSQRALEVIGSGLGTRVSQVVDGDR